MSIFNSIFQSHVIKLQEQRNNNNIQQQGSTRVKEPRSKNALLHFVAGGAGGAVGVIITSPLEVIKTQMQGKNANLLHVGKPFLMPASVYSLYHLVKREGVGALWKGIGPHLVGVVPARAINFSAYSFTKSVMTKLGYKDGVVLWAVSAISAGTAVAVTTSPIWLIKTRMQLQTNLKNFNEGTRYRGYLHCCLNIIREEGYLGFFKGLSASIVGVSESAFQFVLYESIKRELHRVKREKGYQDPDELSTFEYLFAAGISKVIAAVTTYPHEVVRTRMREQLKPGSVPRYKNVLHALYKIGREEGVRGLFGGMGPHVARVVPNSCIMFLTYEFVLDVAHLFYKALHPELTPPSPHSYTKPH